MYKILYVLTSLLLNNRKAMPVAGFRFNQEVENDISSSPRLPSPSNTSFSRGSCGHYPVSRASPKTEMRFVNDIAEKI